MSTIQRADFEVRVFGSVGDGVVFRVRTVGKGGCRVAVYEAIEFTEEVDPDFGPGRAFVVNRCYANYRVAADDHGQHHVFVADGPGAAARDYCPCMASQHRGHQAPCKHVRAVREMIEGGHI